MSNHNYSTAFVVGKTSEEASAGINNVRGWWSGEIVGATNNAGAEFTYTVPDVHYCKMRITEFVPGQKVVWHVLESRISYTEDKAEWTGTRMIFEIVKKNGETVVRFTHSGLVPTIECYNDCSNAWGMLVNGNLRKLIDTGKDQPDIFAKKS
jgi:Activator of Hsp90 ATPase homolog 1-like protein